MASLRDPDSTRYDGIVVVAATVFVIPYTFIGLNRVCEGGLSVFVGDAITKYITVNSLRDTDYGFTVAIDWTKIPVVVLFVKIGFFITTVFEVLSVGVLVSQRFRLVWIIVMTAFHCVTLISMNIFFWENLVLMYAVFGFGPAGLGILTKTSRSADANNGSVDVGAV